MLRMTRALAWLTLSKRQTLTVWGCCCYCHFDFFVVVVTLMYLLLLLFRFFIFFCIFLCEAEAFSYLTHLFSPFCLFACYVLRVFQSRTVIGAHTKVGSAITAYFLLINTIIAQILTFTQLTFDFVFFVYF